MGKSEDEQPTPSHQAALQEAAAQNAGARCASCRLIGRIARPRCVASLVLSLALLLSVVFWLPPFVRRSEGSGRPDKDPRFTADIVASFKLQKPVALLSSNIGKLQVDIFEEIGVPDSSVAIIYLEPLSGLNWTNVVFGVWPYPKSSTLSSTGLSILRASLMSLVIRQSSLHLTSSLFGNSSFFEVLKFPGGITIIPFQKAFLLQKVQMLFNFTLNFPIYQVQDRIDELEDQMKAGLLLNSNENLYIKLTNMDGSTVAPPTIVQTSIVLAVGNRQPSLPRWKELAQTIRNSSAGNLGLNHTLFGRVKQIRLSSFAQHSFNSGGDTASPSPAPQPKPNHHPHHPHHPHHHYKHHFPMHHAPGPASDTHDHRASAPSGCRYGFSSKPKSIGYLTPAAAPADAPKLSAAAPAAVKRHSTRPVSSPHHFGAPLNAPQHLHAPRAHEKSSAPAPNIKSASPLPAVSFTHQQPPSESITDNKPPDGTSSISPAPNTSSASGRCFVHLVFAPLLYSLLSLW